MDCADLATVQTLRSDLALQIARHVERQAQNQITMAKGLGIPQPTLSKIMNGRVADLSLELLIRIAVRARLPVVLQTGSEPAEAGVYVSGAETSQRVSRSKVGDEARDALIENARRLTPEQRLEAHLRHSELITALHDAGQASRAGKRGRSGKRSA